MFIYMDTSRKTLNTNAYGNRCLNIKYKIKELNIGHIIINISKAIN